MNYGGIDVLKCVNGEILEMTQEEIALYLALNEGEEEQALEDRVNGIEDVLSNLINAEADDEN